MIYYCWKSSRIFFFYTSKDEADAIASPEDMMRSMGFDTAAHAKEAQAVYYPEKLHIIGVDMKRPEIMIDGEIFELISLEGHSVGHVGVVTPDGICCLGDAIVSEDVLNVSKLSLYGKCTEVSGFYGEGKVIEL